MNSLTLHNKKIVISAAAEGIGWIIAETCLSRGAVVFISDKNEKALEKIGKRIDNLEEIRSLFLNHPVEDFTPEWKSPDVESTISFLCENYSFNRPRVEKALDKYVQEKPTARQLTLGDF